MISPSASHALDPQIAITESKFSAPHSASPPRFPNLTWKYIPHQATSSRPRLKHHAGTPDQATRSRPTLKHHRSGNSKPSNSKTPCRYSRSGHDMQTFNHIMAHTHWLDGSFESTTMPQLQSQSGQSGQMSPTPSPSPA
jgi:hypothetical protein